MRRSGYRLDGRVLPLVHRAAQHVLGVGDADHVVGAIAHDRETRMPGGDRGAAEVGHRGGGGNGGHVDPRHQCIGRRLVAEADGAGEKVVGLGIERSLPPR